MRNRAQSVPQTSKFSFLSCLISGWFPLEICLCNNLISACINGGWLKWTLRIGQEERVLASRALNTSNGSLEWVLYPTSFLILARMLWGLIRGWLGCWKHVWGAGGNNQYVMMGGAGGKNQFVGTTE